MLAVNKLLPQGRGLAPALVRRAPTLRLDWDTRQKSRFDAIDSAGRSVGVFLPRGSVVRGGDVLVAEDGSLLRVEAADQSVLRITACPDHGSAFDLLRAAYHLGNRHVPIELRPDHLQIEPDPVLADLLRQMGLDVVALEAAFEPEGGAYASASSAHGHAHDHAHDHGQAPRPTATAPATATAIPIAAIARGPRPAAAPHVHGPGCGHDHGHGHDDHGHRH